MIKSNEKIKFLTKIKEIKFGKNIRMNKNKAKNILFCRGLRFENQKEYRIIMPDEIKVDYKKYSFEFQSKYEIVTINEFFEGVNYIE